MTKNKKTFILIQSSSKSVNPDYGFALFLALKTKIWLWQLSEKSPESFSKEMEEKLSREATTNKMGTGSVSKVMLSMGIPMILSMVLQACYNIVDSMFVARIQDSGNITHMGEYAVNALTLAFPVQMLIVAFGIGTGVGVNALLAKSLGQQDKEKVAKVAGNGVSLAFIIYAVFLLFGLFGTKAYIGSQTKDDIILEMGSSYLSICLVMSFGIILFSIYEKLLQSVGKTVYSTIAQVSGAVVNIVLDPIMIFGYFGLPQIGITGAAYATVIGQIISMLVAMYFHYTKNTEVKSGKKYLKLERKIVKEIYVIGLRDAITPMVSFNYGKGDKKRVKEGIFYGMLYIGIIMLIGLVILETFTNPLVGLFDMSKETENLCILASKIIATGFLFAGGNIAIQGVFQALGCGLDSLIVSVLRLCVVVLPLAWLFTKFANADFMIWWAFPIAEFVAFLVAVALLLHANNKIIKPIEERKKVFNR